MNQSYTLDSISTVVAEITTYCNLHCPQCNRFDAQGNLSSEMSLVHADVNAYLTNFDADQFPNLSTIRFEGDRGEPVMHPDLEKFIEFFADKKVEIITNGSLRDTKWWAELARFKNLEVTFSIDGLSDTNHVYRINSDFDRIINNARAFILAGGSAVWKFVAFRHNQHQIDQARKFSQELGFQDFVLHHTNRSWYQGDVWPVHVNGKFLYNIEPSNEVIEQREQNLQFPSVHDRAVAIKTTKFKIECEWARDRSVYIDYQLTVIPCCIMHRDSRAKTVNGKMLEKLMGGSFDNNSLKLHKMSSIITNDFFAKNLAQSWKNTPFYHPTCVGACAKSL